MGRDKLPKTSDLVVVTRVLLPDLQCETSAMLAKTKQKLFNSHAQRCAAYMTSEPSLFDFFSTCSQKGLTNFQEADYPGLPGSSASLYPDFSEN